ncbi:MAG: alpha/beta hydrolase [Candidatus Hydrogenedentes bacterium]|nr:alpha/beta hydrolase [Candidatus Hydrogenedentota bacterium]
MKQRFFWSILGLFFAVRPAVAIDENTPAPDGAPVLALWPDGAPGAAGTETADVPTLTYFPAPQHKATGAAVVVCPGGGYGGLAITYEGYEVAQWLNTAGVSAFVLKYRHAPKYHHPAPLQDAQRAIRTVRARSAEWGINPAKIGILGFSAGGHLTATTGVAKADGDAAATDPIERVSARPDFLILGYPVITMVGDYGHAGSRTNLLGENPDPKLVEEVSPELHVTKDTPPAFLVSTTQDTGVPATNSVVFYQKLLDNGVPAELHVFLEGQHGLGLGTGPRSGHAFSEWPDLCLKWLRAIGMI